MTKMASQSAILSMVSLDAWAATTRKKDQDAGEAGKDRFHCRENLPDSFLGVAPAGDAGWNFDFRFNPDTSRTTFAIRWNQYQ